jgi:hypothetical protein
MAKRFTDTSKWKDSWFQDLPTKYKLLWFYLLDECDNAGVWKPNIRLASFQIGEPFEEIEARRVFADRIEITQSGYWYITKFIQFQYGELSEACKPHLSVITLLKNHKIKGYTKGIHTLKEKEKEKEEDKEEDNGIGVPKIFGDSSDTNFFRIQDKTVGAPITLIYGVKGWSEFLQANMGSLQYPEHAPKFMRKYQAYQFFDSNHLHNTYMKFIEKTYA